MTVTESKHDFLDFFFNTALSMSKIICVTRKIFNSSIMIAKHRCKVSTFCTNAKIYVLKDKEVTIELSRQIVKLIIISPVK